MQDLVAREALRTMARDAAKRFRELVAEGREIPYDLREPGDGSPLPQYVPLTGRFVREHAPVLLELDSFGSACAAIESSDLAGPYLEELAVSAPPDPRKRAELAGLVFLSRLWAESTDFTLDSERLNAAIAELETGGEAGEDEIEVAVPLRGLQMPLARLELATATIVRADTVEVPADARASEGAGAAGWEPTFLAAARIAVGGDSEERPNAGARAVEAFRQLVTTLRLFKAGGVSLGPYAWTRAGADRWRRIATGAGRPRPGGYRLAEEELGDLAVFSRALAFRSTPFGPPAADRQGRSGALARAISRFEAGLERGLVVEALNDYLLAMRFLLEGGGPADLGIAMRVAALCAEPDRREDTRAIVNRALALERELWSGEPAPSPEGVPTPAETAAVVEDLARAILKDAACGHLGSDLRSTADEILLADGIAVGEGGAEHRGGPEEWELADEDAESDAAGDVEDVPLEELSRPADGEAAYDAPIEESRGDQEPVPAGAAQAELWLDGTTEWESPSQEGALEVPGDGGRIRSGSGPDLEEQKLFENTQAGHRESPTVARRGIGSSRVDEMLGARPSERPSTAERVAYLFPRPETTEWDVRELSYDRRRRADIGAS